MPSFLIIETEDGLTITNQENGEGAEEAAIRSGGILVDPGPYEDYDEAYDALLALRREEMDDAEFGD